MRGLAALVLFVSALLPRAAGASAALQASLRAAAHHSGYLAARRAVIG